MVDKDINGVEYLKEHYEMVKRTDIKVPFNGVAAMSHTLDKGVYVGIKPYVEKYPKGSKFVLWRGDPINGEYSIENARRCGAIIGEYVGEDEKPTLDGLTPEEKKCLVAFYRVLDENNGFTFYKKDDMWQSYYEGDGARVLWDCSSSIFNVCSLIILFQNDEDLEKKFIDALNSPNSEEELDAYIEGLKKRFNGRGLSIGARKDIK